MYDEMQAMSDDGMSKNDFEAACSDPTVGEWMLGKLGSEIMEPQKWKGFEKPKTIIIDHREWTTEDVLTPKMSVKRRVLEDRFKDKIAQIP